MCTLALTDLGMLSRSLVPAMTVLSSALYNASLAAKQATLGEEEQREGRGQGQWARLWEF